MTQTTAERNAAIAADPRNARDASPWWRQPYCWLVISGPLVVVIAGFITLFIAYEGADAVEPAYVIAHRPIGAPASLQPAQAARNGAALQRPAIN